MFALSKWIWSSDNTKTNDWVVFRKTVDVLKKPKSIIAKISADTKYFLYINGNLVVCDGGLLKSPSSKNAFYDEIDITRLVKKGKNIFVVECWYYGNDGTNYMSTGGAGFLFEAESIGVYSDKDFLVMFNPAYKASGDNVSPYAGFNINYDGSQDLGAFTKVDYFNSSLVASTEYGAYGECKGELVRRELPLFTFSKVIIAKKGKPVSSTYTAKLQHLSHVMPYFKVFAKGGELIQIFTDRYKTSCGVGSVKQCENRKIEFICKAGLQEFESRDWLVGENIYFVVPEDVAVKALGYRETSYSTASIGSVNFGTDYSDLIMKASRTLLSSMRDSLMSCGDGDRTSDLADLSVGFAQMNYLLDSKAIPLMKKTITEMADQKFDFSGKTLIAMSKFGLINEYLIASGDTATIASLLPRIMDCLKEWEMDENGLVIDNGTWLDNLYNCDSALLTNCWYYSALKFIVEFADSIKYDGNLSFVLQRIDSIESGFESAFGKENGYSSNDDFDDRANAMAVLVGLASASKYEQIAKILISVYNSSPFMEGFVIEALCSFGKSDYAMRRLDNRYRTLVENDNSTLWEDFNILGGYGRVWSGSAIIPLFRCIAGIDFGSGKEQISIKPNLKFQDNIRFVTSGLNGSITGAFTKNGVNIDIVVHNDSMSEVSVTLVKENTGLDIDRVIKLSRGKNKFRI